MLIDWFTVGAQALNFIVLVWLMKRFLYKPVLDAIDAREKHIATELADADRTKADAQRDRVDLAKKNEAFDQQRAALFAKATADADVERKRLIGDARQAADALTAARQQMMASDARNLNRALSQRMRTEVFAVARKTLTDLATASLEATACEVFIVRLRSLAGSARSDLANAMKSSRDGVQVRTAFALPTAQRAAVQEAINATFAMDVELRFVVAPDLVGGIELSAQGQKFAWSIADYLASLERGVDDLLKADKKSDEASVVPAPNVTSVAETEPITSAA